MCGSRWKPPVRGLDPVSLPKPLDLRREALLVLPVTHVFDDGVGEDDRELARTEWKAPAVTLDVRTTRREGDRVASGGTKVQEDDRSLVPDLLPELGASTNVQDRSTLTWLEEFEKFDHAAAAKSSARSSQHVSGVAAMLTTLVALGLVAVGAAHETAMALVVDGAVIAVVSMMPLEPGDEAKARFDGDRP